MPECVLIEPFIHLVVPLRSGVHAPPCLPCAKARRLFLGHAVCLAVKRAFFLPFELSLSGGDHSRLELHPFSGALLQPELEPRHVLRRWLGSDLDFPNAACPVAPLTAAHVRLLAPTVNLYLHTEHADVQVQSVFRDGRFSNHVPERFVTEDEPIGALLTELHRAGEME